ncbi:unnamed protein product [Allacma fusca]|uniref:Uncharacterized protein n=1 Tax=Allacma fusca TaxID=39272 RepID=A0A8J2JSY2_9HEXA|nr:unnamed protein product [Allacma fusca]
MEIPTQENLILTYSESGEQSPQPGPSRLMYQSLPLTRQPKTIGWNQLLVRMKQNAESKILHYNLFMDEILKSKTVLTETQFKKLHEKHKSNLLMSFSNDYQTQPTLLVNAVNNVCLQLQADIDFQYHVFRKKYLEKMKKISLKHLQLDAENFYEIDMENFRPREKSRAQVKSKHLDAVKGALEYFENLVNLDQGLMIDDRDRGMARSSLKSELELKLQEILKGCLVFNIGIYLGDQQVIVGRMDPDNSKQAEIIMQDHAGITFTHEDIKISETSRHFNYFSVRNLIKTQESSLTVHLSEQKFKLLPQEILAIYFEKLFNHDQHGTQIQSIDNVVITSSFACTSSEKKRIKMAASLASMPQVKILSSVVATAVASAVESDYYCLDQFEPKLLCITHCLNWSFSMALVEISDCKCIATVVCTGSNNFKECQDINFPTTHAQMLSNEDLDEETDDLISKIYSSAAQYILTNRAICGKCDSYIVIKDSDSDSETKLDQILFNSFDSSIQNKSVYEGPLAGACFLASKSLESSLLPRNLQVYDASSANLVVYVSGMKRIIDFKNRAYVPELPVFQFIILLPPEGTTVIVEEEFADSSKFLVGRWKVQAKIPGRVEASLITLRGLVDHDGIFSIDAEYPGGAQAGKVYRLRSEKENSSEIMSLRFYYQSRLARLRNQSGSKDSINSTIDSETNESRSIETLHSSSATPQYEQESQDLNFSEEAKENVILEQN